jgi:hypothetical protein
MNNHNNIRSARSTPGVAASMDSNNRATGTTQNRSTPGVAPSEGTTQVGFTTPPVQNTLNNNKRKHVDTVNTVTPTSGNSARIPNIYGTGPPRGTASVPKVPVSILRTPSASPARSASTRSEVVNDKSKNQEQEQVGPSTDSFYPAPGTYDAKLFSEIVQAQKERADDYFIWDPRGWEKQNVFGEDDVPPMPNTFCRDCRCPPTKCHVQLFGGFCQKHIVNYLYNSDEPISEAHAEELFCKHYNEALQYKIEDETGDLDVKLNGYDLPKCVRNKSLIQSLDYVRWYNYHCRMHRGIVVGRGRPQRGQNRLFQDG